MRCEAFRLASLPMVLLYAKEEDGGDCVIAMDIRYMYPTVSGTLQIASCVPKKWMHKRGHCNLS